MLFFSLIAVRLTHESFHSMKKFLHSCEGAFKGAALIVLAFVVIATAVSVGGQTCQNPLQITFSGVIFDCGCTASDEGLTTSRIVTAGNFNGYTGRFCQGIDVFCPPGTTSTYQVPHCGTDIYPEVVTFWEASSTCNGAAATPTPTPAGTPPDPSQPFSSAVCNVVLTFNGGVYHLLAVDVYRGLIFYGTRNDLTGPFTNTALCNRTYANWNNPAVICAFGAATNLTVIAHGGTATISSPPP
jgi:hypothetical protein